MFSELPSSRAAHRVVLCARLDWHTMIHTLESGSLRVVTIHARILKSRSLRGTHTYPGERTVGVVLGHLLALVDVEAAEDLDDRLVGLQVCDRGVLHSPPPTPQVEALLTQRGLEREWIVSGADIDTNTAAAPTIIASRRLEGADRWGGQVQTRTCRL